MAENNSTNQNMELLSKYFELNPEVKKQFDAMTPAEKQAFQEKFFRELKMERVQELHRGRNSDEWQLTIDNLNIQVLQAMGKAPANLAKMPPKKRRETIEKILNSFTVEENSQFIQLSNQAKKQLLENFPPKKLLAVAAKLEELIAQTQNAATKQFRHHRVLLVHRAVLIRVMYFLQSVFPTKLLTAVCVFHSLTTIQRKILIIFLKSFPKLFRTLEVCHLFGKRLKSRKLRVD